MTDFFKNDIEEQLSKSLYPDGDQVETIVDNTTTIAPTETKIKVGEKEYTQEELASLVSLGEMGREVETKYNTKLDRVYPEFTKKSQALAEAEKQLNEFKNNQPKINVPENEDQAIREAKEAAKRLGIVTVEEFEDLLGRSYKKFYEQERAAEKLLDTASTLEKEIDGADGRPKFDKLQILEFMRDNGVQDMMTAYKIINESKLDAWKESQLNKVRKPGATTSTVSTAGASKQPEQVRVTRDNFDQLLAEALEGK